MIYSHNNWYKKQGQTTFGNNDTDVYYAESGFPFGTNILVNDDIGTSAKSSPVINVDINGNPYLVWVDERNGNKDIYYTGATYIDDSLPTIVVTEVSTVTVKCSTDENLKISIPAGSLGGILEADDITISELSNPPELPSGAFGVCYDFGPSGLEFSSPVTITIPHDASYVHASIIQVYWYNTDTGTWSQECITNVQHQVIDSSTHAVSFQTTHFTSFVIGAVSGGGDRGGGGGCAMSPYPSSYESICSYFLPYAVYVLILLTMSWRYKRRKMKECDG